MKNKIEFGNSLEKHFNLETPFLERLLDSTSVVLQTELNDNLHDSFWDNLWITLKNDIVNSISESIVEKIKDN